MSNNILKLILLAGIFYVILTVASPTVYEAVSFQVTNTMAGFISVAGSALLTYATS